MRPFIIKLKKISLFNYFLVIFSFFTFFYVKNYIELEKYSSKYNIQTNEIRGYIKNIEHSDNRITYYIDDLILYDYKMNKIYEIGDYVYIKGVLKKPEKNIVPHLFNYKKYLYSLNIHFIVSIEEISKINKKIPFILLLKRKVRNYLLTYEKSEYMSAFILGESKKIKSDIKDSYSKNGISHLFAISGMHVTILSTLMLFILLKIMKKRNSLIITYFFFIIYLFLTSFSKSIIRATFLFFIVSLKKHFKINVNIIKIFYLFTLIMLIINPYNIFNVSFQFSYIVSFYLMLFKDIINGKKNYFLKTFLTSLISFLCSLPIVINNFYQINLLSIFFNVVFVPLISLIIFPLCLIVFFIKPLEFIFTFFINILEILSIFFSQFKIIIILSYINIFFIIIYYTIITYILYEIKKENYKVILLIIIVLFIHTNINYFSKKNVITFVDVKQGDAIILNLKNKTILIDTGGEKNNEIAKNTIIPYLKSMGIKKINVMVLSHGDFDHMGEAQKIVESFKVDEVIFNCGSYNDLEKQLIKVLEKKKIKYCSCIKELNVNDNKLYFLQTKNYDNENDNSNVIYTELDGYKFMFMGDAGINKEKDILDKYNISTVDVLKVGHHGSKTSSSKIFIDEINPRYSVISVGKNNRYGHPNKEVLNNLEESKIYRTDENGSIIFNIKDSRLEIEICDP